MKKYIRTEDGHIVDTSVYKKVVERTFNGKVVAVDLNHWGEDNDKEITFIPIEDIVRQADTIEELCDCFVDYCKEDDSHFVYNAIQGINEIYGAIWTDKGLIYVAKMNEKGEFELL